MHLYKNGMHFYVVRVMLFGVPFVCLFFFPFFFPSFNFQMGFLLYFIGLYNYIFAQSLYIIRGFSLLLYAQYA